MRAVLTYLSHKITTLLHTDGRHLLHGSFWLGLGQVFSILSGIITSALLAHYLTENDYGRYRYLITLGIIFTGFSLTGIGQSLLQATAKKYYNFYSESIKVSAFYSLGTILISLGAAGYYLYQGDQTLFLGCLIISIFQPFLNTYLNIFSYLQGSGRYRETTLSHSGKMVFVAIFTISTLLFTTNVIVLLLVYFLSHGLASYFVHRYYQPTTEGLLLEKASALQYITYAKHVSAQNLILNISARLDNIIIFTQLGASELAIYSIANIVPDQIKAGFKNISNLMFPSFVKYDNWAKLQKTVFHRSLQLCIALIIITILYITLVPFLYAVLFPKYEEAVIYSQLLALTFPLFAVLVPNNALQSQLEERALYAIAIITSLVNVLSLMFFITNYGLIGAILARFIYRIVHALLSFGFIIKKRYEHRK